MATTFIKTGDCARVALPGGHGQVAEILNQDLCGAKNVLGMLRWLEHGETFEAQPRADTHQLVYLMDGEGEITLDRREYAAGKGAGIYLGPNEAASIRHAGAMPLKLFHLVVPKARD